MQFDVRSQHIELTPTLQTQIERRLRFALSRFQSRIGQITVRLADTNGPRGGIDKRCRIVVDLLPSGQAVVEDEDSEIEVAVNRASDRLHRQVSRILERRRDRPSPMPYPL